MPAEISIRRWTGSAGTPDKDDVTQINNRHRTDDVVAASGVGNAVPVPPDGEMRYSFWQSLRFRVDGGTFTSVNNVLAWPDGTDDFPSGAVTVAARASDYAQATGTVGETGLELTTSNHPYLIEEPVDIFTYSSGAPIELEGTTAAAPVDIGYFLVTQVQVDPLASTVISATEELAFSWDEV